MTNHKIKLVGLLTTIAMFVLPIAEASAHHTGVEDAMTNNIKLRLVGLLTTIAMFALPIAEASAHMTWV